MEKVIMMSEAEYEREQELFAMLESAMMDLEGKYSFLQKRCKKLWNELNRPAIEAAVEAHDNEFYAWCEQKAAEYEEQDYKNWCACQARLYNNGIKHYCTCHGVTEEEAEEDRKWAHQRDYWWTGEKSEGWTELLDSKICKTYSWKGESWILFAAAEDAKERARKVQDKYKWMGDNPYWHIWDTLYDMRNETQRTLQIEYGMFYA